MVGLLLVAAAGAVGYFAGARGEQEVREIPRGWSVCANRAVGYAVAYPSHWHEADLDGERACSFFDPEPIEVPENSDVYGFALEVSAAQETFAAVVRSFTAPPFFSSSSQVQVEISGGPGGPKQASRFETTATGEGLYERGQVSYVYVVNRGEQPPLVLQTWKSAGVDWPARKKVLDRVVATLVLFKPDQQTDTAAAAPALPRAVEQTRSAVLAAADARDYDRLEALADPEQFQYTYGGGERRPAEYWRFVEREPPPPGDFATPTPAEALAAILRMPYTIVEVPGSLADARRIYVWPFAYDAEIGALTAEEREILAPIMTENEIRKTIQFGQYLDWRAGITPDGRWIFFVAGD